MSGAEKILVLGADAAGMSAAHQAIRSARAAGREAEVVALEKTPHTSYSACGLPYWVAGDVDTADELIARSPDRHREMGVDLRTGTMATRLDLDRQLVSYVDVSGAAGTLEYDQLVIATGASPIFPDWMRRESGDLYGGVAAVKTLVDGEEWIQRLTRRFENDGDHHGSVVVAGGGYIGVEMAEAARRRGYAVTLLTRSRVMSNLDEDMSERIEKALTEAGITVVPHAVVDGLQADETGWVTRVVASDGNSYPCDLLVSAIGITPNTAFAVEAGLPVGRWGGLRADPRGQVAPHVWAAGDCCEVRNRVSDTWAFLPLGTHANKMGKAVGANLFGGQSTFDGALGTAITRFVHDGIHLEIARTGLSTAEATAAGIDVVSLATDGRTASGYMPESSRMSTKILAERGTRRLLGAQIIGGQGAGKRIDTVAAALWGGLSIDDLAAMDLAYAPPFATVWEAVQLAARRLADRF
ncbi:CoA-disulfide reductase [Aeromicrobium sp. Root495]|uniref:FAD-dependent oxidoreductase n=1 Tax=Aeromicrobium sp. Root495 TaxID=1736550 RepID=UPI0006FB243D|nr:FAD-dependent oxidoreductase [Aeromicrobium sp. Root495]KQY55705.1 CoA-disulfide reductase [Aeromicrobium sp. Root495]